MDVTSFVDRAAHMARRPARPVVRSLAAFAAVLVTPILLLLALLLWQVSTAERLRLEREALDAARAARVAVDRELASLSAVLEVLSLSRNLREGDLAALHAQPRCATGSASSRRCAM